MDDHSRLAYSEIFPDERRASCLRVLFDALRFFRGHDVRAYHVMADNGVSFVSRRYAKALHRLDIQHKRTRPYRPQTNGRAERFVQTSLCGWAYATPLQSSSQRAEPLLIVLHEYNHHHPHTALRTEPPISRMPDSNLSKRNTFRRHFGSPKSDTGRSSSPRGRGAAHAWRSRLARSAASNGLRITQRSDCNNSGSP